MEQQPFSWSATKDGRVRIAYHGRVVTTLSGVAAERFRARVAVDPQAAMQRATGNFKRGNDAAADSYTGVGISRCCYRQ